MLHHPIYAGAYVYGRRLIDPRRKQPGRPSTGRTLTAIGQWQVLLKDKIPAYISWEQYEANQEQLQANQCRAMSTTRRGPTLLTGLLVCGRCGHRLAPHYGSGYARYSCTRDAVDYGGKLCMSVAARVIDTSVTGLVLQTLEPSALEVSLQVAQDVELERHRMDDSWRLRLERAQHEADRALRQYNIVEPENRLVARTLERQLEEKLTTQRDLQEEHRRFLVQQPSTLTAEERAAIRALASDIPALWNAVTTSTAERQMIVRQLVERIELHLAGESERGKLVVHWVGGRHSIAPFIRPVARPHFRMHCGTVEQGRLASAQAATDLQRSDDPHHHVAQWVDEEVTALNLGFHARTVAPRRVATE
jgi:hypothetical protein